MSLHKLTAGNGYTYLTRQVAAADATDRGHTSLGDFYALKGETPGVWVGSALSGLDGVEAGARVSAEQMVALFGEGRHPDADRIGAAMIAAGHTPRQAERASVLGYRYPVYARTPRLRDKVAKSLAAHNTSAGHRRDAPIPPDVRARIRTDVGAGMFADKHGKPPADARELQGFIARSSRPARTAVAGFDLTFSPVKSVSTLWALAPPRVAAAIQQAQSAAVADTLRWLERDAAFTRLGTGRDRTIEPAALVGAAFTHRDARSGDPDLHTHVAISNKVQTQTGAWLSLYAPVLFKACLSASERYDTRIEAELSVRLGVRFQARATANPGGRPIREVVGVDPALNRFWSSRRADIEVALAVLSAAFQADRARRPTTGEYRRLARRANLQTRQAKHSPRAFADQRATWSTQASQVLGGQHAVAAMIAAALPGRSPAQGATGRAVTGQWVDDTAAQVVATVSGSWSTWQIWHVRTEAERRARAAEISRVELDGAIDRVVAAALTGAHSVPVGEPKRHSEADALRHDGSSVYTMPGARRFTSVAVMDAAAAVEQPHDGPAPSPTVLDLAGSTSAANESKLSPAPSPLPQKGATSGERVQPAGAATGSGRTLDDPATPATVATTGDAVGGADGSAPRRSAVRQPHERDLHPNASPDVQGAPARRDHEPSRGRAAPRVEGYHEALFHAARQREYAPPPDLDAIDTERQLAEANRWDHSPVPRARLLELNEMAADFFTNGYPRSWGPGYVRARLGTDLADHRGFRPGYAPAGWTHLTNHLRRLGAPDDQIIAAGLARVARTGRVIDQFRDRLVLPIRNGDQIHGFIGRRNPTLADADSAGPRYLNTPGTDLFDKGAQLFGLSEAAGALQAGATPVLVEGFFDAIAVTLAGDGRYVGVAPLGTSPTAAQANQLRPYLGAEGRGVSVATDGDPAGRIGAQRAFWMLTARGDAPRLVAIADGQDPAAVLQHGGPAMLAAALTDTQPLARLLLDQRLTYPGVELQVLSECAVVIAAQPPHTWMEQIEYLGERTNHGPGVVQQAVADAAQRWTLDPLGGAQAQIGQLARVRALPQPGAGAPPSDDRQVDLVRSADVAGRARPFSPHSGEPHVVGATAGGTTSTAPPQAWLLLAQSIDSRLTAGQDWPVLARAIQEADAVGCDVARELGRLAAEGPLPGGHCATELAYRLRAATQTFSHVEPAAGPDQKKAGVSSSTGAQPHTGISRRPTGPRVR